MYTNRAAGYITLALEEEDFQKIDWQAFLEELKEKIVASDREYNGKLRVWHIVDCPYNEAILNELYDKYFKTKEQEQLF